MLRYFFLIFGFGIVLIVTVAGFRGQKFTQPPIEIFPDMDRQPKVKAQVPSSFYADGRAARQPVAGTVPLGYQMPLHKPGAAEPSNPGPYEKISFTSMPEYSQTGKFGTDWGTGIPLPVDQSLITRGQERYGIFCAVCHGATGAGNGMAQKFGVATVVSLHQERLRTMADGEIFNTITHGKNTMLGYGDRIPVSDRWAIIAYLRALQLSQGGATLADVPPAERANLKAQ
ncbi:MAG: cytochrome c [Terrimicrobiaceae bacterium]